MEPLMCKVLRLGPKFGRAANIRPQTVLIDFSSVNIGKPLHLGHLRSTVYGNFVRRINELMGHRVIGVNYLGDWGTQFGALIQGYTLFGDAEKMRADNVSHLLEVYVKMHALRKSEMAPEERIRLEQEIHRLTSRMEEGDADLLDIWNLFRAVSLEELKKSYQRMGISFEAYQFESEFVVAAKALVQDLLDRGAAWREGDLVVCQGKEKNVVLLTSSGSTLYITRDLAAALQRKRDLKFDRIHYVVSQSQAAHFQNLEFILKNAFGCEWVENSQPWGLHLGFGDVRGLSTRRGQVILLRDVLDLARERALADMEDSFLSDPEEKAHVADLLGYTQLVEALLRVSGKKPVTADFLARSRVSRNLQYCHARLCQLERNAATAGMSPQWSERHREALLSEPLLQNFLLTLEKTEDVFLRAYTHVDPSGLLQHAQFIRQHVSKMWIKLSVTNCSDRELAQMYLLAFMSARQVLRNVFHTLGIRPVDRM